MKLTTKLWIGVALLVLLSPLGLILPAYFHSGSAWGEWGKEEIRSRLGYLPTGLEKLSDFWKSPFPGYIFKGWEQKSLSPLSFAYVIAAVFGVVLTVGVVRLIGKKLTKKND